MPRRHRRPLSFALAAAIALALLTLAIATAPAAAQPARGSDPPHRLPLTWDRWLDHDEIGERMKLMTETWPELLDLQSIGSSFEGREMWLMTLHNPATGAEDDRLTPATQELVKRESKAGLVILFVAILAALLIAFIFLPTPVFAIGALVVFAYMLLLMAPVWLGWINEDVEQETQRLEHAEE
jgi:hypothetical protein